MCAGIYRVHQESIWNVRSESKNSQSRSGNISIRYIFITRSLSLYPMPITFHRSYKLLSQANRCLNCKYHRGVDHSCLAAGNSTWRTKSTDQTLSQGPLSDHIATDKPYSRWDFPFSEAAGPHNALLRKAVLTERSQFILPKQSDPISTHTSTVKNPPSIITTRSILSHILVALHR
jgi:hypothetical protein